MNLEQIPALRSSIKVAKSECIKLVHKFIFDCDKNRQNRNNLRKFDGFKFEINDTDFETKLNDVLAKFNKIELIQIANFLQTDIGETEREIAHKIISVLTDLDTLSSSFENNSDTEDPDLSQNSQKTGENSLNTTPKENEFEISSDVRSKENNSNENFEIVKESKLQSQNLQHGENTLQYWEKMGKNTSERDFDIIEFNYEAGMKWKAWLLYFEGCCKDNNRDDVWKIRNIHYIHTYIH